VLPKNGGEINQVSSSVPVRVPPNRSFQGGKEGKGGREVTKGTEERAVFANCIGRGKGLGDRFDIQQGKKEG